MRRQLDARVLRTQSAIVNGFNRLFFKSPRGAIRVADIVAESDVGRSTFYEHFTGSDEVLLHSVSVPMASLADAVVGLGDQQRLMELLVHVWENRQRAPTVFDKGRMQERISRLLAEMVEDRLRHNHAEFGLPNPLLALQLAEMGLAPIRGWIGGSVTCTPEALAKAIIMAGNRMQVVQTEALRVA